MMTYPGKIFGVGLAVLCLLGGGQGALADEAQAVGGIDLSHHNEVSDWSLVEGSDLAFVILKATDGMDYLDPTFTDRFARLEKAGMVRGAYHFYETNDDPKAQATWFIQNVALKPGDLPPIVDIERVKAPARKTLGADFKAFLNLLEGHYGSKPIIYTGPNFWDHVMKEHLPDYPLWVAEYGADSPTIPEGWQEWTLWQYTEGKSQPGIEGATDASHYNGEIADFHATFVIQP